MSESESHPQTARKSSEKGADAIVLSGDLGIRDAADVRQRLLQAVSDDGPVRVDLSDVTALDTSIVQLLVATKRSADLRGCAFDIDGGGASPLPDLMAALGMASDELGLESDRLRVERASQDRAQDTGDGNAEPETATNQENSENLFWLGEEELARLRPFFPPRSGKPRGDDRRVLSGIIHVKRNGLRWQDAPRDYGPYKTLYTRWKRWKDKGVFTRMLANLDIASDEPAGATVDLSWLQALNASPTST